MASIPPDERLSALKFSTTGDFLLAGDWGGHCALFARCNRDAPPRRGKSGILHPAIDYQLLREFPCHAREYDYLRSMDISSRVNAIEWLPSLASSSNYLRDPAPGELGGLDPLDYQISQLFGGYAITHHFLTASDTEVKLWSLTRADCSAYECSTVGPRGAADAADRVLLEPTDEEDSAASLASLGARGPSATHGAHGTHGAQDSRSEEGREETQTCMELSLPRRVPGSPGSPGSALSVQVLPRRFFKNASGYHINALSVSPMGDQFLIADDFTVSQWWIEDHTTGHFMVDLRPSGLESLVLMITSAQWHPTNGGIFAFTLRDGTTSICDFRRRCDCTGAGGLHFKSNLNDLLRLRFVDDNHLVVRDVMNLSVFDIRSTSNPVQMYPLNLGFTRELLGQLQSDPLSYFSPFEVAVDWRRRFIATGTYGDVCELFNLLPGAAGTGMAFKVTGSIPKRKRQKNRRKYPSMCVNPQPLVYRSSAFAANYPSPQTLNRSVRISNLDFHPKEDVLAVATAANLYLYASIYDEEAHGPQGAQGAPLTSHFSEYCEALISQ